jgi:hypothetical protein
MMVIMALVTTFMTGPALDLINAIFKTRDVFIPETEEEDEKNTKYSSHLAIMKKEVLTQARQQSNQETERSLVTYRHEPCTQR